VLVGWFVAILLPTAAFASPGAIHVGSLAQALHGNPAQVVGSPSFSLSTAGVRSLRREIARRDPGRIWVAVLPSLSEKATSDLSNALSGYLNADGGGTVIVVAGSHVWGSTSWEDAAAATGRLQTAFKNSRDSLAAQLRRAVDSFASGDEAAGHPQLHASSSGNTTTAAPTTPLAPTPPSGHTSGGGGTSAGSIAGLIVLALVLLAVALIGGKRIHAAMRASHRREQAQADFGKLGEEIEALDIDSSMPNASQRGKDEYSKGIECYQDAERRLRDPGDEYQFERAVDAVRRGRAHVHAADQLFNATAESSEALPTPDPTLDGT
jgi:hypothetical protein